MLPSIFFRHLLQTPCSTVARLRLCGRKNASVPTRMRPSLQECVRPYTRRMRPSLHKKNASVPTQEVLLRGAGDLYGLGSGVAGDAAVEGFGDLLAVSVATEFLLIFRAGHERDFRKNPRHCTFGENDESGFFDAAVAQA